MALQNSVTGLTKASFMSQMVQNLTVGKNALWTAYQDAGPVKHTEIMLALKDAGVYRHWLGVASKEGHDLKMAKAPLRDIFLKHLPDTAPLFGVQPQAVPLVTPV